MQLKPRNRVVTPPDIDLKKNYIEASIQQRYEVPSQGPALYTWRSRQEKKKKKKNLAYKCLCTVM